jgi:drug/metabolite transporter (DMT)-like permease
MTFALWSVALIAIGCVVLTTVSLKAFGGTNLLIFLGLAILCTAIPSFAFAFASERLPSVVTATISLFIPLFAGAFAFVVLGEKVSSTAIPGSVLVVFGVVMILRENNQIRPGGKPVHA